MEPARPTALAASPRAARPGGGRRDHGRRRLAHRRLWDETYHVVRLQNYLDHGLVPPRRRPRHGAPGPGWTSVRLRPGTAMCCCTAGRCCRAPTPPARSRPRRRRTPCATSGSAADPLVGLAATAALVRLLLRRWRWALVAAARPRRGADLDRARDVQRQGRAGRDRLHAGHPRRASSSSAADRASVTAAAASPRRRAGARGRHPPRHLARARRCAGRSRRALLARRRQWARAVAAAAPRLVAVAPVLLASSTPRRSATRSTALLEGAPRVVQLRRAAGAAGTSRSSSAIELPTLLLVLGAAGAVLVVRRLARGRRWATGCDRLLLAGRPAPGLRAAAARGGAVQPLHRSAPAALRRTRRSRCWSTLALAVAVGVARPRSGAGRARWCALPAASRSAYRSWCRPSSSPTPTLQQRAGQPGSARFWPRHDRDLEVQTDYWRTSVRELAPRCRSRATSPAPRRIDGEDRFLPRADESLQRLRGRPDRPPRALRRHAAPRAGPSTARFLAVDAGSAFVGRNCDGAAPGHPAPVVAHRDDVVGLGVRPGAGRLPDRRRAVRRSGPRVPTTCAVTGRCCARTAGSVSGAVERAWSASGCRRRWRDATSGCGRPAPDRGRRGQRERRPARRRAVRRRALVRRARGGHCGVRRGRLRAST